MENSQQQPQLCHLGTMVSHGYTVMWAVSTKSCPRKRKNELSTPFSMGNRDTSTRRKPLQQLSGSPESERRGRESTFH